MIAHLRAPTWAVWVSYGVAVVVLAFVLVDAYRDARFADFAESVLEKVNSQS